MSPLSATRLRAVAMGLTMAATLVVLLDVAGPVRVAPVLAWGLLAPGLAVIPALRLERAVGQVAAAVGVSMAALILASEVMLYLGVGDARWTFAVLAVLTLALCGAPAALDRTVRGQ